MLCMLINYARTHNCALQSSDKTLRLLNGFWHILMKEPGNEALRDELVAWLHARTDVK